MIKLNTGDIQSLRVNEQEEGSSETIFTHKGKKVNLEHQFKKSNSFANSAIDAKLMQAYPLDVITSASCTSLAPGPKTV